ncbi:MAG: type II toxin-antitoxin system VapC family toxin [Limisphaerales bacterium]
MAKNIVDAGPLIAFWSSADENHLWAIESFRALRAPFFTTEPVITEACHFISRHGKSPRPLLEKVEAGIFKIPFQLSEHSGSVVALMEKYGGRMDLADATLVRLSELLDDCEVLTTDYKDFSVYRRHGSKIIPLLAPPD